MNKSRIKEVNKLIVEDVQKSKEEAMTSVTKLINDSKKSGASTVVDWLLWNVKLSKQDLAKLNSFTQEAFGFNNWEDDEEFL